jgi:hypothetical protein
MKTYSGRLITTLAITIIAFATLVTGAVFVPVVNAAGAPAAGQGPTNIRVGRHATYDRIVLDFQGPVPRSFHTAWVPALHADPSGKRITLPGSTFVDVTVQGTSEFDVHGHRLYRGSTNFRTPALRNVRAVAIIGDFERVLNVGIGARHRTWVHVFTLTGPSRVVVDIGR